MEDPRIEDRKHFMKRKSYQLPSLVLILWYSNILRPIEEKGRICSVTEKVEEQGDHLS